MQRKSIICDLSGSDTARAASLSLSTPRPTRLVAVGLQTAGVRGFSTPLLNGSAVSVSRLDTNYSGDNPCQKPLFEQIHKHLLRSLDPSTTLTFHPNQPRSKGTSAQYGVLFAAMFKSKSNVTSSHVCALPTLSLQFPATDNTTTDFDGQPSDALITPQRAHITGDASSCFRTSLNGPAAQFQAGRCAVADISITERRQTRLITSRVAEHDNSDAKGLGLPSSLFSIPQDIDINSALQPSPLPSPSKGKRSFLPVQRSDDSSENKYQGRSTILADWFQGESVPISIGVPLSPLKEKSEFLDQTSIIEPIMPRQVPSAPTTQPSAVSTGRFSFFSNKLTSPIPPLSDPDDEFANLDIKAALLPGGRGDPFSPSSFKNLLQNAEGLLSRLQAAYKHRLVSFRELTAEKEAQDEELEEAQTRARHLKLQLDDMTRKIVEQDVAMMSLVDELAGIKKLRQDEEAKKSIRLVEVSDDGPCHHCRHTKGVKKRVSDISDSGFESESDEESIFSHAHNSQSPTTSTISSPGFASSDVFYDSNLSRSGSRRVSPVNTVTPLDSPSRDRRNPAQQNLMRLDTCPNCAGVRASEAWSVVTTMKKENSALKQRVMNLEGTLDGCLDMVSGLG